MEEIGDAAVSKALHLQPELPEVRLAYASDLYRTYRNHEEARIVYENGNTGCSVSTWTTWWLFIGGEIREKKVSSRLFLWSVSFPAVMTGSVFGFLHFRFFWVILDTVVTLVLGTFAFFYRVAELVLSTALDSEEFYELAKANHVLWVYPDDDDYFPQERKPAHSRRSCRRQRRF
jgi:hypothetical protein